MAKAVIVVGMTGAGKSSFVKKHLNDVDQNSILVFDINKEYYPERPLPDIDDFLKIADTVKNSVIVCEEATVFFSNRGSNKLMRKILVAKRHAGNTIFLLFHSIRSIPFYIYDLCNYVVLFNTNDTRALVESKHELLLPAFDYIQSHKQKNPHVYKIIKL